MNNINQRSVKLMGHQIIGYPDLETNRKMLKRLEIHGFDMVELQLPFSEPVADGPLFLKANQGALANGTTIKQAIEFIETQVKELNMPVYVMTYYNPVIAYGEDAFIKKMKAIGVAGLIIPDAPYHQTEKLWVSCRENQLEIVPIATFRTEENRLKDLCHAGSGFLYYVPRLGVTGTKSKIEKPLLDQLDKVRQWTSLPLAVGFGLEDDQDLKALEDHCDIAIFGSILLRTLEETGLEGVDERLSKLSGHLETLYKKVIAGVSLTKKEAYNLMHAILNKCLPEAKIAVILSCYHSQLPSAEELLGFMKAIKSLQPPIKLPEYDVLDNCGTGGDGLGSINISTTASLVAAAAGVKIAKHGNRAMTSQCGAVDLLEILGIPFGDQGNLSFYFAQDCHPALKSVASLRKQLGFKTIFNILGPLLSPLNARFQLIGVYDEAVMSLMADCLSQDSKKHVLLVHGHDGLDELSISGPSTVIEVKEGRICKKTVNPESFGLTLAPLSAIIGGTPAENAERLVKILKGEGTLAERQIIQLNAGAAIYLYGIADSIEEGIKRAGEILDSRQGYDLLCHLQKGGSHNDLAKQIG